MSDRMRAKTACHCINLRRAANSISKMYDAKLQSIGLSANQFYLIVSLDEIKTASVSDLAKYVGLDRSTLVRTLKPLLSGGLIADTSMENQRNRRLQLTTEGKAKLKQGMPIWKAAQKEIEEKLGADNIFSVERIIEQLDEIDR